MNIKTFILIAMVIIGFSSCTKDTDEEAVPSKPTPEITFSEIDTVAVTQSARQGIRPSDIIPLQQPPTIDTAIVDPFTNKLQVILMYYHANALTSYMRMEVKPKGTIAATSSNLCLIPGYSFWLVFQDITGLYPNTEYEIRIISYNQFGAEIEHSQWKTYKTLP